MEPEKPCSGQARRVGMRAHAGGRAGVRASNNTMTALVAQVVAK